MIAEPEQEIKLKGEKDEKTAEIQRLEIIEAGIDEQIAAVIRLIDQGNLPRAMELIKDSEEIMDGIILHYNSKGMQNRETKNFAEAVKNYLQAISISPLDENLHYNIARAYFEEGKKEKAEEFLGKALQLNPEFKDGRIFYEYLHKVDQTQVSNNNNREQKSGGLFKKLFLAKK